MRLKRLLALGAAGTLIAVMVVTPASAHGRRHHSKSPGSCPVCTVEGCTETGRHIHNGLVYCGYGHESGCCDGSCRPVCTVEGCTETGYHTHNGLAYCGYGHESGYCDGSCLTTAVPSSPAPGYGSGGGHGHHGGHHC